MAMPVETLRDIPLIASLAYTGVPFLSARASPTGWLNWKWKNTQAWAGKILVDLDPRRKCQQYFAWVRLIQPPS